MQHHTGDTEGTRRRRKGRHEKRKRVRKRYVGIKLSDMRQTDSRGKGHVK